MTFLFLEENKVSLFQKRHPMTSVNTQDNMTAGSTCQHQSKDLQALRRGTGPGTVQTQNVLPPRGMNEKGKGSTLHVGTRPEPSRTSTLTEPTVRLAMRSL